jgi:hypothetical protein
MSPSHIVIAFGEGDLAPPGSYASDINLTGQSGCDIIEQMVWLIDSLDSPYEIHVDQETVSPDVLGDAYTRLTVWTNDRTNADFLWLMHELGVDIVRSVPKD